MSSCRGADTPLPLRQAFCPIFYLHTIFLNPPLSQRRDLSTKNPPLTLSQSKSTRYCSQNQWNHRVTIVSVNQSTSFSAKLRPSGASGAGGGGLFWRTIVLHVLTQSNRILKISMRSFITLVDLWPCLPIKATCSVFVEPSFLCCQHITVRVGVTYSRSADLRYARSSRRSVLWAVRAIFFLDWNSSFYDEIWVNAKQCPILKFYEKYLIKEAFLIKMFQIRL